MKIPSPSTLNIFFVFILSVSFMSHVCAGGASWTWFYKKQIAIEEAQQYVGKKKIFFSKERTPPFSQLLFSWNAMRPISGHFSFSVSVRDAATKKWTEWHKMMDWGAQIQKSYLTESAHAVHAHVRFEMRHKRLADGFRLCIQALQGASMEDLRSLAVAISNFHRFEPEVVDNSFNELPYVHISSVPAISQMVLEHPRADSLCSPTSTTMLTSYLTKRELDPVDFAEKSYDTGLGIYGSWPFNLAHAFEQAEGAYTFYVRRLNSFKDIHKVLLKGIPVVVSVRGYLEGAAKVMPHGHLLVIVGYDPKHQYVLVHDPAFKSKEEVCRKYGLKSFLSAWERSYRTTYLAEPV